METRDIANVNQAVSGRRMLIHEVLGQKDYKDILEPDDRDLEAMKWAIGTLNPKEGSVILMYYGVNDDRLDVVNIMQFRNLKRAQFEKLLASGLRKLRQPKRIVAFERCYVHFRSRCLESEILALESQVKKLKDGIKGLMEAAHALWEK